MQRSYTHTKKSPMKCIAVLCTKQRPDTNICMHVFNLKRFKSSRVKWATRTLYHMPPPFVRFLRRRERNAIVVSAAMFFPVMSLQRQNSRMG